MKAKEIRELPVNVPDEYLGLAWFLREIAAQLAEINERESAKPTREQSIFEHVFGKSI